MDSVSDMVTLPLKQRRRRDMNLRRSPWWLTIVSVFCIHFTSGVGAAELECVVAPAKDQSSTIPGTSYKRIKTDYDSDMAALCQGWGSQDAVDHWLYGDYWPAYKNAPTTGKDLRLYLKSHPGGPPGMTRKVCWDTDESDGGVQGAGNLVGAYAWQYEKDPSSSRSSLTLHLLCTAADSRRQGIGLKLMNLALGDAYAKIQPGQSLTLSLVALKSAESFYNQLQMDCQDQGSDKGKEYVVTMQWGAQLAEKERCAQTAAGDERIVYGCMDLADYKEFEESVPSVDVFEFIHDRDDCVRWSKVQFDSGWIPE